MDPVSAALPQNLWRIFVATLSQGKTKVQSIDDNEDMEFTHEAFQVLLFSEEEMWNVYKATSAVMNLGELVIIS